MTKKRIAHNRKILRNQEMARKYDPETCTSSDLAKKYGITKQAVCVILKRQGVELRPERYPQKLSPVCVTNKISNEIRFIADQMEKPISFVRRLAYQLLIDNPAVAQKPVDGKLDKKLSSIYLEPEKKDQLVKIANERKETISSVRRLAYQLLIAHYYGEV